MRPMSAGSCGSAIWRPTSLRQSSMVANRDRMTVKRLLQGVPCVWADQRTAFGFSR
jgi:hypothetical protein